MASIDGKAISYDAIGNPLSDGTWSYRCPSKSACRLRRLRRPRRTDNALRTSRAPKRPAERIPQKQRHRG